MSTFTRRQVIVGAAGFAPIGVGGLAATVAGAASDGDRATATVEKVRPLLLDVVLDRGGRANFRVPEALGSFSNLAVSEGDRVVVRLDDSGHVVAMDILFSSVEGVVTAANDRHLVVDDTHVRLESWVSSHDRGSNRKRPFSRPRVGTHVAVLAIENRARKDLTAVRVYTGL